MRFLQNHNTYKEEIKSGGEYQRGYIKRSQQNLQLKETQNKTKQNKVKPTNKVSEYCKETRKTNNN
jgi:hypothetical protein